MKEKFMKNGVFSLEYDKETLRDMVLELQEKIKKQRDKWNKLREYVGVEWYSYDNDSVEVEVAKDILNKMQELEKGSDSNE